MIDLPPTDLQCVYSSLTYIEKCAIKCGQKHVCTFDQALWWKALQVLSSPHYELRPFVIKLGPFHTIINFLGCIGYVMADTGFSDLLENIYAPNTVPHLMSGKAVNRSTRAHQLVATVLSERLISPLASNSYAELIQGIITKAMEG